MLPKKVQKDLGLKNYFGPKEFGFKSKHKDKMKIILIGFDTIEINIVFQNICCRKLSLVLSY